MKGRFWVGLGSALVASVGFMVYRSSLPRVQTASRNEILSLIPIDLKATPRRDLTMEARLAAVLKLVKSPDDPAKRLTALLDEGPLSAAETRDVRPGIERRLGFPKLVDRQLDEMKVAAIQHDPARCADRAILALRLIGAYDQICSDFSEVEVVTKLISTAASTIRSTRFGLDAAGRKRVLAAVPYAETAGIERVIVIEFRTYSLPNLIRAAEGFKGVQEVYSQFAERPITVGSYDPFETTRLAVEIAREDQAIAHGGPGDVDLMNRLKAMEAALPVDPSDEANLWTKVRYRWAANNGRNTLGRAWMTGFPLGITGLMNARRRPDLDALRKDLSSGVPAPAPSRTPPSRRSP